MMMLAPFRAMASSSSCATMASLTVRPLPGPRYISSAPVPELLGEIRSFRSRVVMITIGVVFKKCIPYLEEFSPAGRSETSSSRLW